MFSQPTADMYTPKKLSYKLVDDNIDKTVKSRYMRLNSHRNKSFHYFHSFAVQNRIDISSLPDVLPHRCPNHPYKVVLIILPSAGDDGNNTLSPSYLAFYILTFLSLTFHLTVSLTGT